jgi:DNA primase
MSIFVDHRGIERWTCFATGSNGTAIDLVMVATGRSVGDAIAWLAERARLDRPPPERPPPVRRAPPPPAPARDPSGALKEYVEACERILWQPAGASIRQWLVEERCLDPEVLRLNRVGADPGPRVLSRAPGLPHGGPAAVFPVLEAREVVYLQARYLHPPPNRGKYDNPTGEHGRNPRCVAIEAVHSERCMLTVVTEGVPDALSAATLGYPALAVLGAGLPDRRVAERLFRIQGRLLLAFDTDSAGQRGSARLLDELSAMGRAEVMTVYAPAGDLNSWLMSHGREAVRRQLQTRLALSERRDDVGLSRSR